MTNPKRPRAVNAEPDTILLYGAMALEALRLARLVSAGLDLSPGELGRLQRMPAAVRAAVLAQQRKDSRYLPNPLRRLCAALERARAEGRTRIEPEEWSPALVRFRKAPHAYGDPGRIYTVHLPGSTNGSRKIVAAIAAEAGVSSATIRAWAEGLRNALDEADGMRRRAWARRRPAGTRSSK